MTIKCRWAPSFLFLFFLIGGGYSARADWSLVIAGTPRNYGTPAPLGYGTNGAVAANTWITNSVAGSVTLNGTNWGSKGWALKRTTGGAPVTNGAGTEAVFAMTTNLTLTWSWTNYWLAIAGNPANYGSPAPLGYGTVSNIAADTWVTNAVVTPAGESAGTRRVCLGWNLRYANGSPIDSGSGTETEFQMRADSLVLTWNWTNEYYLGISANSNGAVDTAPVGWYTNGLQATATATADPGSVFVQWTGDVPMNERTNNPLMLIMDRPRTLQAQFSANPAVEVKQWSGTGNWMNWTNWSPTGLPGPEDVVLIKTGSVTLTDPVTVASVSISNATITFSGWSACLLATGAIEVAGTVSLPAAFTNNGVSNRVWFSAADFTLTPAGRMLLDGKGFQGGPSLAPGSGHGPGAGGNGANTGGGGGHGGVGVSGYNGAGGAVCGTLEAPELPGSGGGGNTAYSGSGGPGGGAVRIDVTNGHVQIDGTISANGAGGSTARGGGGAGGSIWIACRTFGGSGTLRANGYDGSPVTAGGGGGGGGRIAITTDPVAQAALPKPTAVFQVERGEGRPADIGTLYVTDFAFFKTDPFPHTGSLFDSATTNIWSTDNLTVSNGWARFTKTGFKLKVAGDLSIIGSDTSRVQFTSSALMADSDRTELEVGGNVILTNVAQLYLQSLATNGMAGKPDHGLLMTVGGSLVIASNSWLQVQSEVYGGGSPLLRVHDLLIKPGGGIDANARGFRRGIQGNGFVEGYGPGHGYAGNVNGSGAGFGGRGGRCASNAGRGITYGDSLTPLFAGSGGAGRTGVAGASGGNGGGWVRVEAEGDVVVDGIITANGSVGGSEGGGSGGAIFIKCRRILGAGTGLLSANGGSGTTAGEDGAGGGGRIAVWYGKWMEGDVTAERLVDHGTNKPASFGGAASVLAGLISFTTDAEPGTVRFVEVISDHPGTVIILR